MEEREGSLGTETRNLVHDVQRTGATGRRVRLLDLVASAIETAEDNMPSSGLRYPSNSSSSLSDSYGSCSKYSSKNDGRKVAYHGMPCLWEHENALQRSQDPNKNRRCEDRRKRRCHKYRYEPTPAQLRRACHKYVPTPVMGLSTVIYTTLYNHLSLIHHDDIKKKKTFLIGNILFNYLCVLSLTLLFIRNTLI